jgi:hypothetical protein
MEHTVVINPTSRRLSATFRVCQTDIDPGLRSILGTPKKALIEPKIYGPGAGDRFVGLNEIDLSDVGMFSLAELTEIWRQEKSFVGRLLGDGDMMAILEQQEKMPLKWRKKRNIAKPSTENPRPVPTMVNPVVHFAGRVFGGHIPYITFAGENGHWFAGFRDIRRGHFDSSCRVATLWYR